MAQILSLGQNVTYTDSRGYKKAAIVTATPESVRPGGSLDLQPGQANLMVFSPSGTVYAKSGVPERSTVAEISDFFIDGVVRNVFEVDPDPKSFIADYAALDAAKAKEKAEWEAAVEKDEADTEAEQNFPL